jgi:hydrogenase nickel incorporation protein HypA/HybF
MHEFSIAEALAAQVRSHAPTVGRVKEVELRVGALRGLEPESLRMCWQAVTLETPLEGSVLVIEQLPWSITCSDCGRSWTSDVPFVECECGNATPRPAGTDELDLIALVVDEAAPPTEVQAKP